MRSRADRSGVLVGRHVGVTGGGSMTEAFRGTNILRAGNRGGKRTPRAFAIPQQHSAPDKWFTGILNDFPCGCLITTMFRSPCPRLLRSSILALAVWFAFGAMDAGAQDDKPRAATAGPLPVQPLFEAHCQKCHGGD